MFTFFKWFAALLFAGLAWLVAQYTLESSRPYRKITIRRND